MSPLGTLVLPSRPISFRSASQTSLSSSGEHRSEHPLSRLMSVSLGKESARAQELDLQHGLALPTSRNNPHHPRMTLKQASGRPDSSNNFYSSIIYSQQHDVALSLQKRRLDLEPDNEPANEDDEVLSIGRDDEQSRLFECESSPGTPDSASERGLVQICENDPDPSSDTRSMTSGSRSGCPSLQSPILSSDSFRKRNYSSEDSSAKSFPLSLSEAFLSNHAGLGLSRQLMMSPTQAQQHQASLFFSIANILRPDFGLGRSPEPSTKSCPTSAKPTKRPSKLASDSAKKLGRRCDAVIPIDLSRPSSSGLPACLKPRAAGIGRSAGSSQPVTTQRGKSTKEPSAEASSGQSDDKSGNGTLWPAWVYCTRYSDRPSSGPRSRRGRKQKEKEVDEKRPRTAFTAEQLSHLKKEFEENRYLTEKRRQDLAKELRLHENQIKIWFQNKRAKLKKASGTRGGLALQLMAQGLYNHSTIPPRGCGDEDDDEDSD